MSEFGIPTTYRYRRFRSRLEAKWAVFFDQVGWQWEYEPLDLNGWVPDFLLIGDTKVLVEVKAITKFDENSEIAAKIERALPVPPMPVGGYPDTPLEYEVLILGVRPFPAHQCDAMAIGWLRDDIGCWGEAILGRWTDHEDVKYKRRKDHVLDRKIGFCHDLMSYADRITGRYDGGACGGTGELYAEEIDEFWAHAINATQWRR